MRGLLIAFAFGPQKTVGALRPTYWAEEINKNSNIELDVVTATPAGVQNHNYKRYCVENKSSSLWSIFIKDEGLTWRKDLKKFFKKNGVDQYDFVLLTGGPFFHFSLGKYLKKKSLRVIYDFRDPFSYNPRQKDKGMKRIIKKYFERQCLKYADMVITVNDACHDYIAPELSVNRVVVPNGYDERVVLSDEIKKENKYDLFYGGKYYWEPGKFFSVLEKNNYSLCHAGTPQKFLHDFPVSAGYYELGMLTQKEMFAELGKAEIGVIFTMDVPFESTTKIYDYLALQKKILIVTKGEPNIGVLNRELKGYPMHRWVSYNEQEIAKGIHELRSMRHTEVNTDQFSRRTGLMQLISEIEKLLHG
jgi:glycosyltransferase involved in cell wall biosynthesis